MLSAPHESVPYSVALSGQVLPISTSSETQVQTLKKKKDFREEKEVLMIHGCLCSKIKGKGRGKPEVIIGSFQL